MIDTSPCRTCGGPVRVQRTRGEMSVADTTPPIIEERVCTNAECPTNVDPSITDVV